MQKILVSSTISESSIINQKLSITVSLPTFSDSYKDWIGFRYLYVSLVHDKVDMPNIQ